MAIVVQKFGGTSVADADKIRKAARRAIDAVAQDNKVVMVCSARGKQTDQLVADALELNPTPQKREMDMLLSTGEQLGWPLCKAKAPGTPVILQEHLPKGLESISAGDRHWYDHAERATCRQEGKRPLNHERIEIPTFFSRVIPNSVLTYDILVLHVRRIANYHIKATPGHDAVEIHEPVEGLVRSCPLLISGLFIFSDAVFACQVSAQFVFQSR